MLNADASWSSSFPFPSSSTAPPAKPATARFQRRVLNHHHHQPDSPSARQLVRSSTQPSLLGVGNQFSSVRPHSLFSPPSRPFLRGVPSKGENIFKASCTSPPTALAVAHHTSTLPAPKQAGKQATEQPSNQANEQALCIPNYNITTAGAFP